MIFAGLMALSGSLPTVMHAQQTIWFGTLEYDGRITQARYEVTGNGFQDIVYAPFHERRRNPSRRFICSCDKPAKEILMKQIRDKADD